MLATDDQKLSLFQIVQVKLHSKLLIFWYAFVVQSWFKNKIQIAPLVFHPSQSFIAHTAISTIQSQSKSQMLATDDQKLSDQSNTHVKPHWVLLIFWKDLTVPSAIVFG